MKRSWLAKFALWAPRPRVRRRDFPRGPGARTRAERGAVGAGRRHRRALRARARRVCRLAGLRDMPFRRAQGLDGVAACAGHERGDGRNRARRFFRPESGKGWFVWPILQAGRPVHGRDRGARRQARRLFAVSHTFGLEPLQQYLVSFPDGRLQALPWAWDTRPKEEGGQRWFHLYADQAIPAGDPLHWTGRQQNWNLHVRGLPLHRAQERL